jgi:hypothetical protein
MKQNFIVGIDLSLVYRYLPVDRFFAGLPVFTGQPVFYRSTGQTGRPAGPVRSDFFRPVPVPVIKKYDRFHLWLVTNEA